MNTLVWKEWRETRVIPAAFCSLFLVVNLFLMMVQYFVDHFHRTQIAPPGGIYTLGSLEITAVACSLLATVVCGGGIVSREASKGTLSFLTSLPIPRKSLWKIKASVGFAGAMTALLGIIVLGQAFVWANFGWAAVEVASYDSPRVLAALMLLALGVYGVVYAVSYAMSCLSEQTFTSVICAIVACFGISASVIGVFNYLGFVMSEKRSEYEQHMISLHELYFYLPLITMLQNPKALTAIAIGGLLTFAAVALHISYSTFCGQEEPRRRYLIPIRVIAKWTAVYASLGVAAYGIYICRLLF